MADVEEPTVCAACGRPLPVQRGKGRRRLYCDATCRSAGRRLRERETAGRETARRETARREAAGREAAEDRQGVSPPGELGVGSATSDVKYFLTQVERHDSLDGVRGGRGSADPVATEVRTRAERLAAALTQPGESLLTAVAAARELAAAADTALQESVDRARAAGHSWREIGDVLETTRQAAFQRFGRPVDPRTGQPMIRELVPDAADRATAIFQLLAEARWEEVRAGFGPIMLDRLDAERLAQGWTDTIASVGRLERLGEPVVTSMGTGTVVDVPLYFEADDRLGRISFSRDGKIIGLFIRPATQPERPS
jgi:hypothetical protein